VAITAQFTEPLAADRQFGVSVTCVERDRHYPHAGAILGRGDAFDGDVVPFDEEFVPWIHESLLDLDHDSDHDRDHDRDPDHDSDHDPDRDRDHDPDPDREYDRDRDRALSYPVCKIATFI
jgi:hypothetical protein